LRQRIIEEWACLNQRMIDNSVKQYRQCIHSCVAAKCRHFKQML